MKLTFPFRRKSEKETAVTDPAPAIEENIEQAGEDDPMSALSKKVMELEEKVGECERARLDENFELRRRLDEINRANRESSAGSVRGVQSDYFSFSEVKEMTPEQVRKNFSRIVDSMGKWN